MDKKNTNIDWNFISSLEGNELTGYVPDAKNSKSGVTIASGFDLGARNEHDIKGLPKNLQKKLFPFLSLKGEQAEKIAHNLVITQKESDIINNFAKRKVVNGLSSSYYRYTGTHFADLPKNEATVIASVAFQYGDLINKTPNFWKQVTSGNWEDAKNNLLNFGDNYSTRRKKEHNYLVNNQIKIDPIEKIIKKPVEEIKLKKENKLTLNLKKKTIPYEKYRGKDWDFVSNEDPNTENFSYMENAKNSFLVFSQLDNLANYSSSLFDKIGPYVTPGGMVLADDVDVRGLDKNLEIIQPIEFDPNYKPLEDPRLKNNFYLQKHMILSGSYEETTLKLDKLAEEFENMEKIKGAPPGSGFGFLFALATDPSLYLTGKAIMDARKLAGVINKAKKGFVYTVANTAPFELLTAADSETYTAGKALFNVMMMSTVSSIFASIGKLSLAPKFRKNENFTIRLENLAKNNNKTRRSQTESKYSRENYTDAEFEDVNLTNTTNSLLKSDGWKRWQSNTTNYADELRLAGYVKSGIGIENVPINPLIRMMYSSNSKSRLFAALSGDLAAYTNANVVGIATSKNIDAIKDITINAPLYNVLQIMDDNFYQFHNLPANSKEFWGNMGNAIRLKLDNISSSFRGNKSTEAIMKRSLFYEEVTKAMRNGDKHDIPLIESSARAGRVLLNKYDQMAFDAGLYKSNFLEEISKLEAKILKTKNAKKIDKLKKQIEELKITMKDVHKKGPMQNNGNSYFPRLFNHTAIDEDMTGFRALITKYTKVEPGSNRSLDETVDDIIAHVLRKKDQSQIDDLNNLSTNDFVKRAGSSFERVLKIPDNELAPYLINDAEIVLKHYAKTMGGDIVLTNQFGDITAKKAVQEITDQANELIKKAKTPQQVKKLEKELKNDIRDFLAIRDRFRGTFGAPNDPHNMLSRFIRIMKNINIVTLMGGAAVSSIPDAGMIIMRHSTKELFDTFNALWVKEGGMNDLLRNMNRTEARNVAQAAELQLGIRQMTNSDRGDIYSNRTKFERMLHSATNTMMLINLLNAWNGGSKELVSQLVTNNIARLALQYVVNKKPIHPNDIAKLAMSGIDLPMLRRIGTQVNKHGSKVGEENSLQYIVHTDAWTDPQAVFSFRYALNVEIQRTIITPGSGDRALWTSYELGSLIAQYKSFAQAFTHRVLLRGAQEKDINFVNGVMYMLMLGVLVEQIKRKLRGQELQTDANDMFVSAVDRSGLLGIYGEGENIISVLTNGKVSLDQAMGVEQSPTSMADILRAVGGANVAQAINAGKAVKGVVTGDVNEASQGAEKLVPFNTHPVFQGLDTALD